MLPSPTDTLTSVPIW